MTAKQNTILGTSFFLFLYIISTVIFHDNFHDGWGYYKEKNYKQAHTIWLPLAEQGNARAQFHMGKMYDQGEGVPQDYNEAFKWYELAAKQGYGPSKHYIYQLAKKGVAPALKVLTDQANNGVAEAQFHMGEMYDLGEGVPQDYNEAFKWYGLAAKQGYFSAQTHLGNMYDLGHGVSQDFNEAINRYRFAANRGHAQAQFNLGVMFYKGRGVIQDYLLADIWFIRSSLQKNQEAFKYISLVEKLMSPQQRKKAQQMAKYWERWD